MQGVVRSISMGVVPATFVKKSLYHPGLLIILPDGTGARLRKSLPLYSGSHSAFQPQWYFPLPI